MMLRTIDDLPMVKASSLRAHGYIGAETKTTLIRFDDSGVEYQVGVTTKPLPCGAVWSIFICPRCNGRAQRLRLLDGVPSCGACVRASGLIYRSQSVRTEMRHLVTAPPRMTRLNSDKPLRVHARPGRTFDGRANIEIALKRSFIVARRAKIRCSRRISAGHDPSQCPQGSRQRRPS
jgi:hypothetical protein